MAIYCTGDTHGDFSRFSMRQFPEQKSLTREDCVIILGDFGGIWDGGRPEQHLLDELEQRPFTTLFLDGNHENYDLLSAYPAISWNGGLVQPVRPHVLHLCRGQVFQIQGKTFFVLGGAASHDIQGGVLDPNDPDWKRQAKILRRRGISYRVLGQSWWPEELPSPAEYETARRSLDAARWQVDYVLTHCAPVSVQHAILGTEEQDNALTAFLEEISRRTSFTAWYFGHYHRSQAVGEQYRLLYTDIERLL